MTVLPVPAPASAPDPHAVRLLLRNRRLHMHWQPIVDLATRSIAGHEGLVRTRPDCAWRSPDQLFAAARREGCTLELEHACLDMALAACCDAGVGRLFVNLSAEALAAMADAALPTRCGLRDGLPLAGVVLELTEHERVHDLEPVQRALARWRAAGATLALDDFGDGRSSLRLWSELRPEYVKIDKYFVRDVHRLGDKLKTIRALQQLADTFGSRLASSPKAWKASTSCWCCATWAFRWRRATCWAARLRRCRPVCPRTCSRPCRPAISWSCRRIATWPTAA